MKKVLLLAFLLILLFIPPAMAGSNLIQDPNFQNIPGYWSFEQTASGSAGGDAYFERTSNAVKVTSTNNYVPSGHYGYLTTNNKIDLTYVSTISITVTGFTSSPKNSGRLYLYISSDGSRWDYVTDFTSGSTGVFSTPVSKTGQYYIRLGLRAAEGSTVSATFCNLHADSAAELPSLQSQSIEPIQIHVGESVSASVTYSGYPTSPVSTYLYWGDGSNDIGTTFSLSKSHTYQNAGSYIITSYSSNVLGTSQEYVLQEITVLPAKPVITSVTTVPSSEASPGTPLGFTANFRNDVNQNGFTWEYGDGSTDTGSYSTTHTYTTAGTYHPRVKAAGPGGTSDWYNIPTVYIGTSAISVNHANLTYNAGENVLFSWSLLNPDYSKQYTFRVYASDSSGTQYTQVISPVPITSASMNSYSWSTNGASGYYIGVIYEGNSAIAATPAIMVQKLVTLSVTLSVDSVTYTNATDVILYRDGIQAYEITTSSGVAVFENIVSGTYMVAAITLGYSQQSATITVLESTAITIDFKTGTTAGGSPQGAGVGYPMSYITFRVIDKNTGLNVAGARISGSAVEATNPVEWLVNQLGGAIGQQIIGSQIAGVSDDSGVVSFIMYPNFRYNLQLEHDDLQNPLTRTFSPSVLSTEYPWYVEFPHTDDTTSKNIRVSASVTDSGLINVTYHDLTQTTSTIAVNVFTKNQTSNAYDVPFASRTGGGSDTTIEVQLVDYLGKDIKIEVVSKTGAYGTVTKTYYHTFLGPLVDLGFPPEVYIWICLLTAVLIGGVAPFVNSYAACFCIVFVEWIYWFMGWFFIPGQFVVLPLLIFATVLSVLYYIQSRK